MINTINIVADTHDVPALKNILSKLDNVFSLGDVVAVDTQEYLKNVSRYSKIWKCYTSNNFDGVTKEDVDWFYHINVDGWKKQLKMISKYNKLLYINRGNSDYRMLKYFTEMRNDVEVFKKGNNNFHFIEKPSLEIFNNTLVIFIPYQDKKYDLSGLMKEVNGSFTKVIMLGHCPLFKQHEKQYYVNHYEAVKSVSERLGKLTYFHGHVHADNTYRYILNDLPNVEIITPKAEDCDSGMGFNHDYIELNTLTGNISVKKLEDDSVVNYKTPTKEYTLSDHWNSYIKPTT